MKVFRNTRTTEKRLLVIKAPMLLKIITIVFLHRQLKKMILLLTQINNKYNNIGQLYVIGGTQNLINLCLIEHTLTFFPLPKNLISLHLFSLFINIHTF